MAQRKARGAHAVTKSPPKPPRPLIGERDPAPPPAPTAAHTPQPPLADPAPVELEALVTTYAFDTDHRGEPYAATVRFSGARAGVRGKPTPADAFVREQSLAMIQPGSGRMSVTACIYGLYPGEWTVGASLLRPSAVNGPGSPARGKAVAGTPLAPAAWSWRRWTLAPAPVGVVKTRWAPLAPLAQAPAILPGSYPALVLLASLVALVLQSVLLTREGISADQVLTASLVAIVFGLAGAKVWYAAEHPSESRLRGGWGVDGFLVVVPVVGALILLALDLPVGVVLDASTPGLFLAVAIARVGCFLTGCCAGRPTASRWGVWSSDRRIGARRVPTQLLESATGLLIGVVALAVVLSNAPIVPGGLFIAAYAAYGFARQRLLRLRSDAGRSPRKLPVTAAAVVTVLLVIAVLMALRSE